MFFKGELDDCFSPNYGIMNKNFCEHMYYHLFTYVGRLSQDFVKCGESLQRHRGVVERVLDFE